MKTYIVTYPIAGSISVEVEAESEKEAIEKGFNVEWNDNDINEINKYEFICQGNVLHAPLNEIEVEEIE